MCSCGFCCQSRFVGPLVASLPLMAQFMPLMAVNVAFFGSRFAVSCNGNQFVKWIYLAMRDLKSDSVG